MRYPFKHGQGKKNNLPLWTELSIWFEIPRRLFNMTGISRSGTTTAEKLLRTTKGCRHMYNNLFDNFFSFFVFAFHHDTKFVFA